MHVGNTARKTLALGIALVVAFAAISVAPGPFGGGESRASAAVGDYTTYQIPEHHADGMVTGADGYLYLYHCGLWCGSGYIGPSSIGRIDPGSGQETTFTDTQLVDPLDTALGPDGNVWFSSCGTGCFSGSDVAPSIGRITPGGAFQFFSDARLHVPGQMTQGPDGAIWFINGCNSICASGGGAASLGRISTAGTFTFFDVQGIGDASAITAGSDGNIWLSSGPGAGWTVAKVTTGGASSLYTVPDVGSPGAMSTWDIANGPDGNVWFTLCGGDCFAAHAGIGKITPTGVITVYDNDQVSPESLVTGPDGGLWFTTLEGGSLGRISVSGTYSVYPAPSGVGGVIATRAQCDLWFTAGPTTLVKFSPFDKVPPGCDGPTPTPVTGSFKYVALGDSFSAGEGIEPFFEPRNQCHRSQSAYPVYIEAPGLSGTSIRDLARSGTFGAQWGFQACSGATTDAVLSVGWHSDPLPQLALNRSRDTRNANDLPVDGNTDLVTITIGGNDVNFADILQFCAFSNDCTTEKYQGKSLANAITDRLNALGPKLETVYRQIRAQAPHARILVAGYPQLFPASAAEQNCGKLAQRDYVTKNGNRLQHHSIGFSQTEQNFLRGQASRLNQTIADRVARAGVGATFVPVDGQFASHEICGNGGEWINAFTFSLSSRKANDQSFHPNAAGQRYGYAAAINAVVNP